MIKRKTAILQLHLQTATYGMQACQRLLHTHDTKSQEVVCKLYSWVTMAVFTYDVNSGSISTRTAAINSRVLACTCEACCKYTV